MEASTIEIAGSTLVEETVAATETTTTTTTTTTTEESILEGTVLRKKKRPKYLVVAVRPVDGGRSVDMHISKRDHQDYFAPFLYLQSDVRITYTTLQDNDVDNGGQAIFVVQRMTLIHCAPDPAAVEHVLEGIVRGTYDRSVLRGCEDIVPDKDHVVKLLNLRTSLPDPESKKTGGKGRTFRLAVGDVIRHIRGKPGPRPHPRVRDPFIRKHEYDMIEQLQLAGETGRLGWRLATVTPRTDLVADKDDDDNGDKTHVVPESDHNSKTKEEKGERSPEQENAHSSNSTNGNPPTTLNLRDTSAWSAHGVMSRQDYCYKKKLPQIRWMVQRVKCLNEEVYAG